MRRNLLGVLVAIMGVACFVGLVLWCSGIVRMEITVHQELVGPDEPVFSMIMRGDDLASIERELRRRPEIINASSYNNVSLLGCAVEDDRRDVAALLLEMGADPNWPPDGYSALAVAVLLHNTSMAEFLLEHGADPFQKYTMRGGEDWPGGEPENLTIYDIGIDSECPEIRELMKRVGEARAGRTDGTSTGSVPSSGLPPTSPHNTEGAVRHKR